MRPTYVPALAASMALLLAARADCVAIEPVFQQRFVEARAESFGATQTDSESAPDLNPFDAQVAASLSSDPFFGQGSAEQNSAIGLDSIDVSASVFSSAFGGGHLGSGESVFELIFDLTTATAYSIEGTQQAEVDGSSIIWLRDENAQVGEPGYQVFYFFEGFNPANEPGVAVSASGVLDPGRYRLWARTYSCSNEGPCGEAYGRGAYSFSFIVPEPATAALLGIGLAGFALTKRRR